MTLQLLSYFYLFFSLCYIFSAQKRDTEKLSAYECGFDFKFYLVATSCIILCLEIAPLFLWCILLNNLFSLWFMTIFVIFKVGWGLRFTPNLPKIYSVSVYFVDFLVFYSVTFFVFNRP